MILYNVNPADTFSFATLIGCFQNGDQPANIQYGSAWWFLDQKEGITAQINALSNVGLLSRFIGMVTDSRSFMSYPRHEYFRRVLCDIIGQDVARGELPDDDQLLGRLVKDICHRQREEIPRTSPAQNDAPLASFARFWKALQPHFSQHSRARRVFGIS